MCVCLSVYHCIQVLPCGWGALWTPHWLAGPLLWLRLCKKGRDLGVCHRSFVGVLVHVGYKTEVGGRVPWHLADYHLWQQFTTPISHEEGDPWYPATAWTDTGFSSSNSNNRGIWQLLTTCQILYFSHLILITTQWDRDHDNPQGVKAQWCAQCQHSSVRVHIYTGKVIFPSLINPPWKRHKPTFPLHPPSTHPQVYSLSPVSCFWWMWMRPISHSGE